MKKSTPNLVYFLAFVSMVFIGILIYAYIVAKRANPVMLDEHGHVTSGALLAPAAPARVA